MKILLTGHMSFNLMAPFYKLLKEQMPDVQISIYGLTKSGISLSESDKKIFEDIIVFPPISQGKIKKAIFSFKWFNLISWKTFLVLCKQFLLLKFRKVYHYLYGELIKKYENQQIKAKFSEFDIINIHYLSKGFLSQIKYVNENQKLVLSFWGSDLFLESGETIYSIQLKSLNRANAITLHTYEMEQILLSKFGRHLKNKVYKTIFGCDLNRLHKITELQNSKEKIQRFKSKYGILDDRVVVQIGYSGSKGNQHIEIINTLLKYKKDLKDEVVILVPTTYANRDAEYFEELKNVLINNVYDTVHLTEYLSDEEALMLPLISNILINVRDADALNNSMIEALYAGNLLITGCWLPYGILRRKKISFVEVESFDEIGGVIQRYCEDANQFKLNGNLELIDLEFSMQKHITNWVEMYRKLK